MMKTATEIAMKMRNAEGTLDAIEKAQREAQKALFLNMRTGLMPAVKFEFSDSLDIPEYHLVGWRDAKQN